MVADAEKVIVSDGIISLVPKAVVAGGNNKSSWVFHYGIHIRLLSQDDK